MSPASRHSRPIIGRDQNCTIWRRSKPAWLTAGATIDRRAGTRRPRTRRGRRGNRGVRALEQMAAAERRARNHQPDRAPAEPVSKRCSRNARCISSRTPPAMTTTNANSHASRGRRMSCWSGLCKTVCSEGANCWIGRARRCRGGAPRGPRHAVDGSPSGGRSPRKMSRGRSPCARRHSRIRPMSSTVSSSDSPTTKPTDRWPSPKTAYSPPWRTSSRARTASGSPSR